MSTSRNHYRVKLIGDSNRIESIQGLRGLAVLLVLAYHLEVPGFSQGFLGVDGFFVISGFVITRVILKNLSTGSFSYGSFLMQRARRLLPSLTIVSLFAAAMGWALFSPTQLKDFGYSLVGVATYTSNFVFAAQEGYFEQSAAYSPLLHTWSLAVEEQFYLLFPLLFIFAARRRANVWVMSLSTSILSLGIWLGISLIGGLHFLENWSFFMLPSRIWEFGVGSLIASSPLATKLPTLSMRQSNFLFATAVGSILFGLSERISELIPLISLLAVVAGFATLISIAESSRFRSALTNRIITFLGSNSYAIYLWHFPLIAASQLTIPEQGQTASYKILILVLSILLGWLTTVFIENPVRRGKLYTRRVLGFVGSFVFGFTILGVTSQAPAKWVSEELRAAEALTDHLWVYMRYSDERVFNLNRLQIGGLGEVQNLVVGSSRGMLVKEEFLKEKTLNLSVSGATLEDVLALSVVATDTLNPRTIYVGLDPWTINEFNEDARWESIGNAYQYAIQRIEGLPALPIGELRIPTRSTANNPVMRIYSSVNSSATTLVAPDGLPANEMKKSQDGSIVYSKLDLSRTQDQIHDEFPRWREYGELDTFKVSREKLALLEKFITFLEVENIQLVFFLSPFHPDYYVAISDELQPIFDAEQLFRKLASNHAIQVIGSFDSNATPCGVEDFIDAVHPSAQCMEQMFTQ